MAAIAHRTEHACTTIATPSPKPGAAGRREHGNVIEFGTTLAFAALAVAVRIGADTAAHGYQPCFERIVQLFG
jgi:hypothetical protein